MSNFIIKKDFLKRGQVQKEEILPTRARMNGVSYIKLKNTISSLSHDDILLLAHIIDAEKNGNYIEVKEYKPKLSSSGRIAYSQAKRACKTGNIHKVSLLIRKQLFAQECTMTKDIDLMTVKAKLDSVE